MTLTFKVFRIKTVFGRPTGKERLIDRITVPDVEGNYLESKRLAFHKASCKWETTDLRLEV